MHIHILKETSTTEARVAMVPTEAKTLLATYPNLEITVEAGAGTAAGFTDAMYKEAGVKISQDGAKKADIILHIASPATTCAKKGALEMGLLNPLGNDTLQKDAKKNGVNLLAMESIPRTSRAQAMDALSSQANIGGYRAVIEAAHHYGRFMPLMMTAAGAAKPAKVIVLGAGVAGLQAIATARRLGAQVFGFDIRPEVKEQIESLGAVFLEFDLSEYTTEGEGGYAGELSAEGKAKQQELLQEELATADIVITTALIPGRPAPELITEAAVKAMKHGSVIVDLAAANGGNCKLTEADKVVEKHGVTLVGHTNLPSQLAGDASTFFARNVRNLLQLLLEKDETSTSIHYNMEDDILAASVVLNEKA